MAGNRNTAHNCKQQFQSLLPVYTNNFSDGITKASECIVNA